jgi:hypothetical protein
MSHRQDVCPAKWLNLMRADCGPTPALVPIMTSRQIHNAVLASANNCQCPVTRNILMMADSTPYAQRTMALRVLARMAEMGDSAACRFQAE